MAEDDTGFGARAHDHLAASGARLALVTGPPPARSKLAGRIAATACTRARMSVCVSAWSPFGRVPAGCARLALPALARPVSNAFVPTNALGTLWRRALNADIVVLDDLDGALGGRPDKAVRFAALSALRVVAMSSDSCFVVAAGADEHDHMYCDAADFGRLAPARFHLVTDGSTTWTTWRPPETVLHGAEPARRAVVVGREHVPEHLARG